MAMLQRRFASSLYAVRKSLERMRARREKILQLTKLIEQAQILEEREVEHKLIHLKQVLSDNGVFAAPKMKLLLFTEHKETLDYLAGDGKEGRPLGKLRQWGLSVTQIHGGMKVGDRDTPGTRIYAEREFHDECLVLVVYDQLRPVRHYFVDEAGDGTLFNARGQEIVETQGCSRHFMLGLLDVPDPEGLARELDSLRAALLSDPYFRGVPSMQPGQKKTALLFHAKDDVPEVRREVLALLRRQPRRFFAVIRDKRCIVEYVRQRNQNDPAYRYNTNELYDYLVRRLFKTLLQKDDGYHITFARRGGSDRTAALESALQAARLRFEDPWHIHSAAAIHVIPKNSTESAALQAADYFL